MNQVNVIGHIGTDPEIRSFSSGKRVIRFSVAINSYSKDGKQRPTTWIPCESWDQTAERMIKCAEKGILKGRKIQLTGYLALNQYDRPVGNQTIKVSKLYVKVSQFTLLSRLQDEQASTVESPELQDAALESESEAA